MPVIDDQVGLTLDRIILATDFSYIAGRAAGYARALAKRFSSHLTLAHVVDLSVATRSEDAVVGLPLDEMRRQSAENQERLLAEMTKAGVRATAHTVESHIPAAAVVKIARELRADLVVTGTDARQGLNKAILGSFAEGLIHHASCPVLTIGPNVKAAPQDGLAFHTIVFATDFSPDAGKQAALALSLAQDSVARIYLCHVIKHPGKDLSDTLAQQLKFESELEGLVPRATLDWCEPECVVENGAVAPHILALAGRVHADLIVLGAKRSATWLTHLMDGTVEEVLLGAACPVMTLCAGW